MAKVLVLIAMVLLTGFSGGTGNAFAEHAAQPAHQTLSAGSYGLVGATAPTEEQYISAYGAHTHHAAECCSDLTCFNSGHCHHACVSALMATPANLLFGAGSPRVNCGPHDLPLLDVARSITKPPKA